MEPVPKKIKLEICENWTEEEDPVDNCEDLLELSDLFQINGVNHVRARQAIDLIAPISIEEVRIVQEEFAACISNIKTRIAQKVPILQEDLSDNIVEDINPNRPSQSQFWDSIVPITDNLDQEALADIAVLAANNPLHTDFVETFLRPNTFDI